ncbi:MAG TPA: DoxX family membrane protein, partial [Propionibacterium sp.]|nr:DoxX family membrane protein [Propionibacterium sp.]
MNLVRGIGRLLLGGFFIVQGAKAVKEPAQFAPAAEPIAQRFVPLAQKTLPPEASAYVPEDPETLVRLNGALSVLGGLGMATGIGRRGGAYMAAASMLPHVLAANPKDASPSEKNTVRSLFVRNLALLGAALVVSQDTAGQPSLLWRA